MQAIWLKDDDEYEKFIDIWPEQTEISKTFYYDLKKGFNNYEKIIKKKKINTDYFYSKNETLKLTNIKIKNIKQIDQNIVDDLFEDYKKYFWRIIDGEMYGNKNMASASDLLRLIILYQEGGVYLDADIKLDENNTKIFNEEKLT